MIFHTSTFMYTFSSVNSPMSKEEEPWENAPTFTAIIRPISPVLDEGGIIGKGFPTISALIRP